MATAEAYRRVVVARAGGACEYCRLLQDASGVTFHIDHVRPRSVGGQTTLNNLALSCPGCNLSKAAGIVGIDATGTERALFNPREYEPWLLGWHLHFVLDRETGRIVARTPTGETTIRVLKMNGQQRAFARQLQIAAGLIA
jgi:hypothetical protein